MIAYFRTLFISLIFLNLGAASCVSNERVRTTPSNLDETIPVKVQKSSEIIDGDRILSPHIKNALRDLVNRLDRAHLNLGKGRPAATPPIFSELVNGGQQGFTAYLTYEKCFSIVTVGQSEEQVIDMLLYDDSGDEVARDMEHKSSAAVHVCPQKSQNYRVIIRMYQGTGAFALRFFGS